MIYFLTFLDTLKLYHFSVASFSGHKASDELYTKLVSSFDKFWEVYQGRYGKLALESKKRISYTLTTWTAESVVSEVSSFITYLRSAAFVKLLQEQKATELLNILDEIVGDLNQFLYLLTFN